MQFEAFIKAVTCFVDRVEDVHTESGELVIQVRDEIITVRLSNRQGEVIVDENDDRMDAPDWIVKRLARVPLLADRIISYVSPPDHFIRTTGKLLDQPNHEPLKQGSLDRESDSPDVVESIAEILDRKPAGTTSVLYLTSDAGEGKTSLIDYFAVEQARAYKNKKTDWLLVPISLGGRTFLRFDDVVVSELVNKLRFQLLYYDAFLELVRLGVLVPAFDGFEEMIVEASSGEAISALGNLVQSLHSAGTLLVAARKAYFDYPSFGSQARLFDAIGSEQRVTFGRLSLDRWNRNAFIEYARERGVDEPSVLFERVADRLSDVHPVLTRAVLVKRLVDVAIEQPDLSSLLERIGHDPQDYFHGFVDSLIEREALNKWLDKSGDPPSPLLTVEQHHELLSMLGQEMWLCSTDEFKFDVISVLVEMFASDNGMSPEIMRQIGERIRQHSLLVVSGVGRSALSFDHDDFRVFYIGQALGRSLVQLDVTAIRSILENGVLPPSATEEAAIFLREHTMGLHESLEQLQTLADNELPSSFVRENCGMLMLEINKYLEGEYQVRNMNFPAGALSGRTVQDLTISESYFHATSLTGAEFQRCHFINCEFERLEVDSTVTVINSRFDERCRIASLVRVSPNGVNDEHFTRFDPEEISLELQQEGFDTGTKEVSKADTPELEPDDDLRLTTRFLRAFLRATELNEGTIQKRLGVGANHFIGDLLPRLLDASIVRMVPYQGHGSQRRVKLAVQMESIEEAMKLCGGKFEIFVEVLAKRTNKLS